MPSDEVRPGYREALADARAVPVTGTDEISIPGLGSGEMIVPALWAVQDSTRRMLGAGGLAEIEGLTSAFLTGGGDGPWHD